MYSMRAALVVVLLLVLAGACCLSLAHVEGEQTAPEQVERPYDPLH